jgi:hypothetical protein
MKRICAEEEFMASEEIRNVDEDILTMHNNFVEYQEQWGQVSIKR